MGGCVRSGGILLVGVLTVDTQTDTDRVMPAPGNTVLCPPPGVSGVGLTVLDWFTMNGVTVLPVCPGSSVPFKVPPMGLVSVWFSVTFTVATGVGDLESADVGSVGASEMLELAARGVEVEFLSPEASVAACALSVWALDTVEDSLPTGGKGGNYVN